MNQTVCKPLYNLKEVYDFLESPPEWGKFTSTLFPRARTVPNATICKSGFPCHSSSSSGSQSATSSTSLSKTLVCHDMKNGYHDDSYLDGTDDHSAYLFYHWSIIDIFIYFSHHFITIPPLCWINAAHKHGVQILGTIITEWEDGFKICEKFLETEEEYKRFAGHLVSIAKYLKLDGWFINIENKVVQIENLIGFVKYLTDTIHENIPGSIVLWYDSVTADGKLEWQNCLNEKNRIFFDNCDGIFTNYTWNLSHLKNSHKEAGDRKHDVFIGIDVWGRNFWKGGHFNTVEAIKEIHLHDLSFAIFAPAWTHEGIKIEDMNHLNCIVNSESVNYENEYSIFSTSYYLASDMKKKSMMRCYFLMRENAFWNTIWPYLNTKGPTELPFRTYFCIGSGETKRLNGYEDHTPWFNLREQQYQISFPMCAINTPMKKITKEILIKKNGKEEKNIIESTLIFPNTKENGCMSHYMKDSFHGGNCIKICPLKLNGNESFEQHLLRLFLCNFKCNHNFVIYFVTKCLENQEQQIVLLLSMKNNQTQDQFEVNLCYSTPSKIISNEKSYFIEPMDFNDVQSQILLNNLKFLHPSYYIPQVYDGWEIRYFNINFQNSSIMNINCKLVKDNGAILLGGLGIVKDITPFNKY